jgi:hypothetical protein
MSGFEWTKAKEIAALSLAEGSSQKDAADNAGVADRTIRRWLEVPEFSQEVDRLSLMIGIANRAYRLRLANRVIKQFIKDTAEIETNKDALDWLKFAQTETDGVKLDLLHLLNAHQDGE